MILYDIFFLVTLLAQYVLVWLLTAKVWFPQVPPVPAAIGQGFITLCVAALAGGFLSGFLWFLLIAYPVLFSWMATSPVDAEQALRDMADNRGKTFLIAISPYLYMLIRLYGQIKQRQDWQSRRNGDRL